MDLFGGIEAGGTKFVCGVGSSEDGLIERAVMPTTAPEETLSQVIDFFERARRGRELRCVGVGAFGPIGLDGEVRGVIGTTPKAGWSGYDLIGRLSEGLRTEFRVDTDVAVAARAEHSLGSAVGFDDFVYVTVGTGVGGAVCVDGEFVRGALHPEVGHMRLPHDLERDPFPGICPYHGDCLEGLASGPAVAARVETSGFTGRDDPRLRELVASYIAVGLANLTYVVAPERIVLGGGVVGDDEVMLEAVRRGLVENMNEYAVSPAASRPDYIVHPALGSTAGVMGGLLLAEQSIE